MLLTTSSEGVASARAARMVRGVARLLRRRDVTASHSNHNTYGRADLDRTRLK